MKTLKDLLVLVVVGIWLLFRRLYFIQNRVLNYILMPIVGFLLFLLLYWFYNHVQMYEWLNLFFQKVVIILLFVGSMSIVWTSSKVTIGPMFRVQILLFGQPTDVWLRGGTYFVFFLHFGLFRLETEELQSAEKKDIIVSPFDCQDKKGKKIRCAMNGDWEIGDTEKDEAAYRKVREGDMKSNLKSLLERTGKRILGKKEFWTEIIGQELHTTFLKDPVFLEECTKYGIKFPSLVVEVTSGNLDQDDLNQYREQLTTKFKEMYPKLRDEEIADRVEVQLKIAKKIISTGPINVRVNDDDNFGGHHHN